MFLDRSPHLTHSQPSYMRKKRLYQQSIRKNERETIFSRLRRNAQLPDDVGRLVHNLPQKIHQLIKKLSDPAVFQWEETIAYILLDGKRQRLTQIFEMKDLSQNQLLFFLLFLMKKSDQEVFLFNQYFHLLQKRCREWTYPQRMELLRVYNFMLWQGHQFVINEAQQFLSTMHCNRFFGNELKFYILILKKFPTVHNQQVFLPFTILRRLSQQIGIHFYSQEEKIMMMEVLIMALYLSPEPDVAKSFDLDKIFINLQYFFGFYNTNKMLIDRSIILIYNINIDITSYRFVNNSCFKVVVCEMKNKDNPPKIRSLMAQLYLSSIYHYPEEQFYLFLTSNLASIFGNFELIIDQFSHQNDVRDMILGLLRVILSVSAQEKNHQNEDKVSNYIRSNASFLKTLQTIEQSKELLQQYRIFPQQDQL